MASKCAIEMWQYRSELFRAAYYYANLGWSAVDVRDGLIAESNCLTEKGISELEDVAKIMEGAE